MYESRLTAMLVSVNLVYFVGINGQLLMKQTIFTFALNTIADQLPRFRKIFSVFLYLPEALALAFNKIIKCSKRSPQLAAICYVSC